MPADETKTAQWLLSVENEVTEVCNMNPAFVQAALLVAIVRLGDILDEQNSILQKCNEEENDENPWRME
jgi:hypothetical protein